jgi:hypothetical protein
VLTVYIEACKSIFSTHSLTNVSSKPSIKGDSPCAVTIRSSKKNFNLSTAALSSKNSLNFVGSALAYSIIFSHPSGAGISFLLLHVPVTVGCSLIRI